MPSVETTFRLSYTDEQYERAKRYVDDMKKYPNRIYWRGKKGMTDEELIYSHIAHKILSGFYNHYDPSIAARQIIEMTNQTKSQ